MSRDYLHQQHFLRSPRVVAELIGHTNIRKNDVVYDLGAGSGVISSVLALRVREVVAVESEQRALLLLRDNLKNTENTRIIKRDLLRLKVPSGEYKIFSNIPFSLSAKVVEKFVFSKNPPKSMNLIVQKQFARKLVESESHFNSALGAQLWPWFSVRIRKPLRRSDFTPPPGVDTVLLEIKPLDKPEIDRGEMHKYVQFIDLCFARQKHFTAASSNTNLVGRKPSELSSQQWAALYSKNK